MDRDLHRDAAQPATDRRATRPDRRYAAPRESLGGEAITIPGGGRRIADDVLAFARANNVTQIIIGKSTRSRWFEILHGSVVHDLVRRAGNISVHVIAGEDLRGEPVAKKTVGPRRTASRSIPRPI